MSSYLRDLAPHMSFQTSQPLCVADISCAIQRGFPPGSLFNNTTETRSPYYYTSKHNILVRLDTAPSALSFDYQSPNRLIIHKAKRILMNIHEGDRERVAVAVRGGEGR